MINASFLDPTLKILLCYLIREIQYGMLRFYEIDRCILIGDTSSDNGKIIWTDLSLHRSQVAAGIILNDQVSTIFHVFHQFVIIIIHPFIGVMRSYTCDDRIEFTQVIPA